MAPTKVTLQLIFNKTLIGNVSTHFLPQSNFIGFTFKPQYTMGTAIGTPLIKLIFFNNPT